MNCSDVVGSNLAERYLLGDLSPAEQEGYERHFFGCEQCFGELRSLQAIHAALQQHPRAARSRKDEPRQWLWRGWAIGGAVAASLVVVMLLRQFEVPERVVDRGAPPAAVSPVTPAHVAMPKEPPAESRADGAAVPSTAKAAAPLRRAELLAKLARVQPPRFLPSVLRGMTDEATAAFQQGMKFYVAGEFGAAAPLLRDAARLDPARPDIAFFLAASELLSGDATAAAGEFNRTIEMGDTPFLEEAHYYLAKAHLRLGDAGEARRELTVVKDLHGSLQGDADSILKQLESVDTSH